MNILYRTCEKLMSSLNEKSRFGCITLLYRQVIKLFQENDIMLAQGWLS